MSTSVNRGMHANHSYCHELKTKKEGGIAHLLSCGPCKLEPGFESQWELGSGHQRGEDITNCKSHITPVSLTDWCIMIFYVKKRTTKKQIKQGKCVTSYDHFKNLLMTNSEYPRPEKAISCISQL